ncbi:hypothetical protein [Corynebacterium bouchesdurhonense]|uniref:hypothetical protein n=1 Tax=Corynebacterium bouchesdurhonense TaxID=1720192 RepID=UPI000AD73421
MAGINGTVTPRGRVMAKNVSMPNAGSARIAPAADSTAEAPRRVWPTAAPKGTAIIAASATASAV